jgi:hypothetical protein
MPGAGVAVGHPNSVHVCLGTGIGVCFLVDGQPVHGHSGIIEAGHVIAVPRGRQCGCGSRGCLEAYVCLLASTASLYDGCGVVALLMTEWITDVLCCDHRHCLVLHLHACVCVSTCVCVSHAYWRVFVVFQVLQRAGRGGDGAGGVGAEEGWG